VTNIALTGWGCYILQTIFQNSKPKTFFEKLWGKRGVGLIWWEKCPWNGTNNNHQTYGYGYLNRPSLNTSQNPTSSASPNQKLPAVPAARCWTLKKKKKTCTTLPTYES
jgi:hypothetical protein